MKEYPWFDQVPEGLKTRNQLAEQGLRPGGPVVARVVWKRGNRWANLYDVAAAKPKKPATEAQLAALTKANAAPRTREEKRHASDRAFAADCARAALSNPSVVILDTETTDLGGYLVQIAAINIWGEVLLNTLVRPNAPIADEARAIHGISDAQLVDAPTFADLEPQLRQVLAGKEVWVYNSDFDMGILQNELDRLYEPHWPEYAVRRKQIKAWFKAFTQCCAMEHYAAWWGDYSEYHGDYRWQRLPGGDHTALGDCVAVLKILREMAADGKESE